MKKIIVLLLGVIAIAACENGGGSPDLSDDGLRLDRVLSFKSSADDTPYSVLEMQYNGEGNLTVESLFDYPESILITYTTYEYTGGKLFKKTFYDGQPGSLAPGTYITYEYKNGKVVKESLFRADASPVHTTNYTFSGDDLIETYKVSGDLGVHHHYKYKYSIQHELVFEEVFMYDEELESFTKYFYDASGRVNRTELYDHTSTLTSITEKKYTSTEKLPSEEWFLSPDGSLLSKHFFIYDSHSNLIETDVVTDQGTNALFKRKFEGNRMTEEITYAPTFGFAEWTVTRYEYSKK